MSKIITACLVIVGLINFVPLFGIQSAAMLENAYSITLESNDLIILMRHRALLFGLLGGFTIYAAFVVKYQIAAMICSSISLIGFAVLVILQGENNASIDNVFIIDIIAIFLLVIASAIKYYSSKKSIATI